MDYNLPIEIVNENLDHVPKVVNSIDDIKKRFKQFIDDGNTIEKQIENSKALCEEAEYMVESAKSYNNAWYKIGSDKKKMRLMAESQEGMAKAITNLQQGQALLFKYQKTLSFFCIACLYFVKKEQSQLDDLSSYVYNLCEQCKNNEIPESMKEEIYVLNTKLEDEKRIREQRLAEERRLVEERRLAGEKLLDEQNKKTSLTIYALIGLLILLGVLFFINK